MISEQIMGQGTKLSGGQLGGRCGSSVGKVLVARHSGEAGAEENFWVVIFLYPVLLLVTIVSQAHWPTMVPTRQESRHISSALQWLH